jgi:hypothetical protein
MNALAADSEKGFAMTIDGSTIDGARPTADDGETQWADVEEYISVRSLLGP